MTYTTGAAKANTVKIHLPVAKVKPTVKRLGTLARLFFRLQGTLPTSHRYRRDIGLDKAKIDPHCEAANLMTRNGVHF